MTQEITETVVVEGQDLTLPLIVWRRWYRPMPGMVERILDTNPHLADLGPVLPLGTRITIPIPQPEPREQRVLDPVRLW